MEQHFQKLRKSETKSLSVHGGLKRLPPDFQMTSLEYLLASVNLWTQYVFYNNLLVMFLFNLVKLDTC